MELDFTKLNSLAFAGFTEIPPEKQTSKTPLEPFIEPEKYKKPPKEENALQRQADAKKQDIDRSLAIYKAFLKSVKAISLMTSNSVFKGA